eukprot:EG_transcript_21857
MARSATSPTRGIAGSSSLAATQQPSTSPSSAAESVCPSTTVTLSSAIGEVGPSAATGAIGQPPAKAAVPPLPLPPSLSRQPRLGTPQMRRRVSWPGGGVGQRSRSASLSPLRDGTPEASPRGESPARWPSPSLGHRPLPNRTGRPRADAPALSRAGRPLAERSLEEAAGLWAAINWFHP